MKAPTATFLGLALIAAAIFFRESPINPAYAKASDSLIPLQCFNPKPDMVSGCWAGYVTGNKMRLVTASQVSDFDKGAVTTKTFKRM